MQNGLDLRAGSGPLHSLDFCSGAGGLTLGLKLLFGDRIRTVCYIEREAKAAATLVARMGDQTLDIAPVWDDLQTFNGRPWRGLVDIYTGGYPCQGESNAGNRRGRDDPRWLWPHVRRVAVQVRPRILFFENVAAHLQRSFRYVRADLRRLGYRVAAGVFSAEEMGAPHLRERLFILAVADPGCPCHYPQQPVPITRSGDSSSAGSVGEKLARAEGAHRGLPEHGTAGSSGVPLAHATGTGLRDVGRKGERISYGVGESLPLFPPGRDDFAGWARVLAARPDLAPALPAVPRRLPNRFLASLVAAQSRFRGVAAGLADRADRLRLVGNGVSPVVACVAFASLWLQLAREP